MKLLILYFGIVAVGYIVGNKKAKGKHFAWTGTIQNAAILLLVFFMGTNIGSDERVVGSLGTIGLKALAITIGAMVGSLAMTFLARKLVRLNKKGVSENE